MDWVDRVLTGQEFCGVRAESMVRCHLLKCDLRGAKFSELATEGCIFEECNFTAANLSSSTHKGSHFLNCDFTGADLFGANLEHCRMVGSTFAETVLSASRLKGGDWSFTSMRMQDLDKFDLREMKFEGADLYGCSLKEADLRESNLTKANLHQGKLQKADLRGADLSGIDFRGVEVKGARMTVDQALLFAMSYGIRLE